ncbi:MAG TPA: zinc ribbon domain-containing protein [Candidatus Angelobacter sp.]|nr:zinc ribbon domain-containing protein [Candidatus Angelobacter sp.]
MPLYEYQCKKCKHKFEKIQKFSDPPVRKCPECGGPVEKVMHAPNVQFKGTGWYVTDYGGKDKSEKSKPDGSSDKKETTAKEDGAKSKDKDSSSKKSESKKSESKKSKD